jgi:hypothetical protein
MEKVIKLILLTNSERLISEIVEVGADIGEPDCKLINPHEIWEGNNLCPWMMDNTNQKEFMISSDKIITMTEPNSDLLEKYINLTKDESSEH